MKLNIEVEIPGINIDKIGVPELIKQLTGRVKE